MKFGAAKKEKFLALLREGSRRGAAAKECGVSYETVRLHMGKDPVFATEVDRAEMEANEHVEDALLKAALDGNVTACQVWLYNRMPGRWQDKRTVTNEHKGVEGAPPIAFSLDQAVAALQRGKRDRVPQPTGDGRSPDGSGPLPG